MNRSNVSSSLERCTGAEGPVQPDLGQVEIWDECMEWGGVLESLTTMESDSGKSDSPGTLWDPLKRLPISESIAVKSNALGKRPACLLGLLLFLTAVSRTGIAQEANTQAAAVGASDRTRPLATPTVLANEDAGAEDEVVGITFGETHTHHIKVGVRIKAGGICQGVVASVPVPMDWPEQRVQIVKEEISPEVRNVSYRTLDDGVKQMLINIPRLNAGDVAEAVLTLSIERQVIVGPPQTDLFSIPKSPEKSVRKFLGDSPYIETRNNKIRTLARKIIADKETDWARVEAIYDYVREHVEYRESELKGAVDALADGHGDCEAMTSLFIALCRANKIPARMVWVTDHSYPEFYLIDNKKQGHWFPCQVSGSRAFGNMPEVRPIVQKGDNYRIPETKERRRYVAVQLKASAVRGAPPTITEILELTNAP